MMWKWRKPLSELPANVEDHRLMDNEILGCWSFYCTEDMFELACWDVWLSSYWYVNIIEEEIKISSYYGLYGLSMYDYLFSWVWIMLPFNKFVFDHLGGHPTQPH